MWGMIATWRMAAEGVEKGAHMLAEGQNAGDAIETAIREVEDFPYYKSEACSLARFKLMSDGILPVRWLSLL